MRMVVSFIAGMVACSLFLFGAKLVLPVQATEEPAGVSDNVSSGMLGLLPDIEKIYRESLMMPFIKVEDKIYDEDVAEYYRADYFPHKKAEAAFLFDNLHSQD